MDNRRKQYWIDKGFQKKAILQLMALVVGSILAAHLVAMGYLKLMQAPKITAGMGAFSAALKSGVTASNFFSDLWLPALITCLLGILFVLGFGLLYSHRIAGPLFNLKRMLNKIGQGDLTAVMHIRATDEFHDVEDAFNLMVAEIGERHHILRQALEELPADTKRKLLKTWDELFRLASDPQETQEKKAAV